MAKRLVAALFSRSNLLPLLAALIYFKRNAWIKEPIVRFVSALLVKNDENETNEANEPNQNL